MRIITWNINGIRSLAAVGSWKKALNTVNADIVCLQETKVTRELLKETIALEDGFNSYFGFSRRRSGYSGVATFCRHACTPIRAEEGLAGTLSSTEFFDSVGYYGDIEQEFSLTERKELDAEGRAIITQHDIKTDNCTKGLIIINVYCPRFDSENPEGRDIFKMKFNKLLELRANALITAGFHVVILGDINISHKPIDHCDPYDKFDENAGRQWLDHFLYTDQSTTKDENCHVEKEDSSRKDSSVFMEWRITSNDIIPHQFVDSFRQMFPRRELAFTCWNTELNCRSTNYGTRIDYIFVDIELIRNGLLTYCDIKPEILGSDHCPVVADINIKLESSPKLPTYCTKNFPEFAGKQQKISTLLKDSYCDNAAILKKRKLETHSKREYSLQEKESLPHSLSNNVIETKTTSKKNQSNITNYFGKKENARKNVTKEKEMSKEVETMGYESVQLDINNLNEKIDKSQRVSQAWKEIMSTGAKKTKITPFCKGHKEPCVLRTVKKTGDNQGKKFFACARGVGRVDDPNSQCNFFEWQ